MAKKKIKTTKKKATERHWPWRNENGLRLTGVGVWINAMAYDHAEVAALRDRLITLCEATEESYHGNAGGLSCAAARLIAKQMNALGMLARLVGAFHYEMPNGTTPPDLAEQEREWDHWRGQFQQALAGTNR